MHGAMRCDRRTDQKSMPHRFETQFCSADASAIEFFMQKDTHRFLVRQKIFLYAEEVLAKRADALCEFLLQ
jgi:hypothetical protein